MTKSLNAIAQKLMEPGKGILAADESEGTIGKRFDKINLPNTLDLRRDYREMLFRSTKAMTNYISGVILTEETLGQSAADGKIGRASCRERVYTPTSEATPHVTGANHTTTSI